MQRTHRTPPRSRGRSSEIPPLLDTLEPRVFLSTTPFPLLADLEDPTNPVLRVTTSFGDVDIEMFASEAPDLVAAYINGLERGFGPDLTFFHRLVPGVILQGGLYGFDAPSGLGATPIFSPFDSHPGVGRANAQRTVAAAALTDGTLFGVSAFIFNLRDNSTTYDPDQVVVFGRVVDDRSWDVIQTIASLDVADLSGDPTFTSLFPGSFHQVPVTRPYTPGSDGDPGDPITSDLLVQNFDVSLIRAPGAPDFYRSTIFQPEGYLNSGIHEFVPIENPHDEPVYFELNARYELFGQVAHVFRDDLVTRGVIAPHSRGGVTLRVGNNTVADAVRYENRPFTLELRSTLPLGATLSHYDYGSTIAHPFADIDSTTWVFPAVEKDGGVHDFLVWYNPTSERGQVEVTLIDSDGVAGDPVVFDLLEFRRGGVSIADLVGTPDGSYAVRIVSSVSIVASRSHYTDPIVPGARREGYSEAGFAGDASTVGVIPLAADPGDRAVEAGVRTLNLFVYNPGMSDATVSVDLYLPQSSSPFMSFPDALVVGAGRHAGTGWELPQIPADRFTLVYSSSEAVFASYSMVRAEAVYGGGVPVTAATIILFAEGFLDPGRAAPNVLEETIAIYNPHGPRLGVPERDAEVTITFRFADGFELTLDRTIGGGEMDRVEVSRLPELIEQAEMFGRFYYSIELRSNVPIVAQMLHTDLSLGFGGQAQPGGGFVYGGTVLGGLIRLDQLPL